MNAHPYHHRPPGIRFNGNGQAEILLWAPLSGKAELIVPEKNLRLTLTQEELGYYTALSDQIQPGDRYRFALGEEKELPDPASLCQPDGIHGPSQAVNLRAFHWTDGKWKNPPLEDYIIYELHTGTFTEEGTFAAMEEKLSYLKDLGITAIEIMPVAQFPGERNWGYDGAAPYAVQNSYGGAEALQHLTDTCHRFGIAIILDVVYNHLGPEGNYLPDFGPYFTSNYHTPWGDAVNFDDEYCYGVRHYFIQNALMWLRDFHIDALRLDAVHAIKDLGAVHILRELKESVNLLMAETGRTHYLIAELDLNDPRYIDPTEQQGFGMDAQWIDEFHHALRVTAGEAPTGYYADFLGIKHLAKAYTDAYVYDGQYSPHRKKFFGTKATGRPGRQFIVFSQNHDQVGNRMKGERINKLLSFEMKKTVAAAVILSPYLPMLFMGEEWSEARPFLYFVSHTDEELAEAVREGRKEEFAAFHAGGEAPDPVSENTFRISKLQWDLAEKEPHRTILAWYRRLIALRKEHPALRSPDRESLTTAFDESAGTLTLYRRSRSLHVLILLNFSQQRQVVQLPDPNAKWHKLLCSSDTVWKSPSDTPDRYTAAAPPVLAPESVLVLENS